MGSVRKQIKTIEDAAENWTKVVWNRFKKQILGTNKKLITNLFSKYFLSEEVVYELNKITGREQKVNSEHLIKKILIKKIKTCFSKV